MLCITVAVFVLGRVGVLVEAMSRRPAGKHVVKVSGRFCVWEE